MWTLRPFRFLGLALAFALGAAQAKPTPPTIGQLAAYAKLSGFSISPDGKHISALEGRGEDRVILVWKIDEMNKPPSVIGSTRMKISGASFIKNDLLAVSMFQPYDARGEKVIKMFTSKLYITDLQGKEWNEAMPQERAMSVAQERLRARANPAVLDSLPNDPDHILIVSDDLNTSGDVYKVNVRTNRAERVLRADEKTGGYVTDLDGNVRARIKADVDTKGAFIAAEIREVGSGNWVEHFRSYVKERDVVAIVGFAKDPNTAFVLSNVGLDKAVIYEYDVPTRKQKEILFKHRFFDAGGIIQSRNKGDGDVKFGDILGMTFNGPRGTVDREWTSPKLKSMEKAVRDALGLKMEVLQVTDPENGQSANIEYDLDVAVIPGASTPDLNTMIVTVQGSARPPEFYLLRDNKLTLLTKAYPDIDPASLGKTRLIYYKARDGLDIPAFVTTPNTELCGPAPWPAVVHPHGGPWSRDEMNFDGSMWVPLMASRCFAVLQPQFRGSQGWGRKLWKAGDAEWGQKMQDDKDDGAKWMVDQGIAKKDRMAMFGFSYGGYSAMAAAVRPPVYKCAIAGAGVSDHKKIWKDFYQNAFFRERQAPTVDGLNPVDLADKLTMPIMVYHGDRDQVVPIEQSVWYVDKAKSAGGKPVVYHEIADYAHGPAWTRKIMGDQLKIIEDYLLKDCGGKGL